MYNAYIYTLGGTRLGEFSDIAEVSCFQQINTVGQASFVVYNSNPSYTQSLIIPYSRVDISTFYGDDEVVVFQGVMVGVGGSVEFPKIILKSMDHMLEKYKSGSDQTFTTTIDNIISAVATQIQSKIGMPVIADCDITDSVAGKVLQFGGSYMSLLSEISLDKYEFSYKYSEDLSAFVLSFKNSIGVDRTYGDNYFAYEYDINDISGSNIADPGCDLDFTPLANRLYGKSSSGTSVDESAGSIAEFGVLEDSFSTNGGTGQISYEALKKLEETTIIKRTYTITPKDPESDFFTLGIGDLITVNINRENSVLDYSGYMKVVEKGVSSGDDENYTIKVSTNYGSGEDIIGTILKIKADVKKLQLQ